MSERHELALVMGHERRHAYAGLTEKRCPEGTCLLRVSADGMQEQGARLGPLGAAELGTALVEWARAQGVELDG